MDPQGHGRVGTCGGHHAEELTAIVLNWFVSHGRDFPWRHTFDPFRILVAEVLLRRTQAPRVAEPYVSLIHRYPDAHALAAADTEELRRWFRPLGLVARADHLIGAARILVERYAGKVPNNLEALVSLPAIGAYSARSVLCLAFGARVPMVDEGSGRVLRRVLGIPPRGTAYSDSGLLLAAAAVLPERSVREFNLALIDIAAAYCHARAPDCDRCPLSNASAT